MSWCWQVKTKSEKELSTCWVSIPLLPLELQDLQPCLKHLCRDGKPPVLWLLSGLDLTDRPQDVPK